MSGSREGRTGRCLAAGREPVCAGREFGGGGRVPEICATPCISADVARKLRELAERYETAEFSNGDPSCVLKRYTAVADVECAAFIAAVLAFGRRDQFLPKIASIFEEADRHGGPEKWLLSGNYASFGAGSGSIGAASCEGACAYSAASFGTGSVPPHPQTKSMWARTGATVLAKLAHMAAKRSSTVFTRTAT